MFIRYNIIERHTSSGGNAMRVTTWRPASFRLDATIKVAPENFISNRHALFKDSVGPFRLSSTFDNHEK